jgi:nucleotide-binding universal stress UspA family protein
MAILGSLAQSPPRRILFATDFSAYSETALLYGVGLCRRFEATLYAVTVVSAELTFDARPPDPFYLRHSAEKKMAKLVNSGVFQDIEHVEMVQEGFELVSQILFELIDSLQIDLIVLGMRGRDGLKKLMLGSVAEEIVNCAPCPVLTVGPHVPSKSSSKLKLGAILCATDLQPGSERVLTYALSLADEDAHLTLLHVLKTSTNRHSEQIKIQAQSEVAMKQLLQLNAPKSSPLLEMQSVVEIGAPDERIPKMAEDLHADLIVIGPHHTMHPRIAAHLPWAMLHRVLRHAQCPVLRV